jgi:Fe-S-cluster-containing dehydrogenase component
MRRREFLKNLASVGPAIGLLAAGSKLNGYLYAAETEKQAQSVRLYGMGIDVDVCIGCGRCAVACKKENHVPQDPFFYRTWVERYVFSVDGELRVDSPNGGAEAFPPSGVPEKEKMKAYYVPKLCNQCSKPPCVQVCPVGATFQTKDGVVLIDPDYCIGCRYCIQACPYGARYLHPQRRVADKCTFCYHRIVRNMKPACVEVCPTSARIFGEPRKSNTPLWEFMRKHRLQVLKPNLRTEPKVYYNGIDSEVR